MNKLAPIIIIVFAIAVLTSNMYISSRAKLREEIEFKLKIVSRGEWGALNPRCTYDINPYINAITIHHTATSNVYSDAKRVVRAIQNFHMFTRKWCDIGYHFLIDKDGNIYEGRPLWAVGAHVKGHNTGNIGVSVIGNYEYTDINEKQLNALINLLTWLCYKYNIPIENIKGHGDYNPATKCPGKYLYKHLPEIREMVKGNLEKLRGNSFLILIFIFIVNRIMITLKS